MVPHSASSSGGCSDGGDITGGVEFVGTMGSELEHARGCGDRGGTRGAHDGLYEGDGELREGLVTMEGRWRSRAAEVEDGDGNGDAGHTEMLGLTESFSVRKRSPGTRR